MLAGNRYRGRQMMAGKQMANTRFRILDLASRYLWLGLFAFLPSTGAWAATLPSLTVPEGVGVNIHFSKGYEKDLDLIAAAGIKVVRADFPWAEIERYQGVYDWSAYDELAEKLVKRGIRPMFIL